MQCFSEVMFSSNPSENRNSDLLINFIQSHDLIAANTLFRKKSQVRFNGLNNRKVLLDYILVRKKWCKSVSDCEIRCVSSVASDHNLIKAKVKWVLKNNKMVKRYEVTRKKSRENFSARLHTKKVTYGRGYTKTTLYSCRTLSPRIFDFFKF